MRLYSRCSLNRRFVLPLVLMTGFGCDPGQPSSSKSSSIYVLVDAEKRAAEFPTTFEIPDRGRRQARKPGNLVKLILEVPAGAPKRKQGGERPWVIIQEVMPGPRYKGKLDNDLLVFTELKSDELIEFGPEHIIQLWEDMEKK